VSKKPPRLRAIAGGLAHRGRTLVLVVRVFEDPTMAMQESVKALQRPDGSTRAVSVATARELLTDQRVQLLHAVRKERPESIAALARLVGRPAQSVTADLELLERAGVIAFEAPTAKSPVRAPRVAFDRVEIRLDL
jgi:predicted transcriptional regulator